MFLQVANAILSATVSTVALHLPPVAYVEEDALRPWNLARSFAIRHNNPNRTNVGTIAMVAHSSHRLAPQEHIEEGKICVPEAVGGASLYDDGKFMQQVERGVVSASRKSIIMAGLLRDIESSVDALFHALSETGKNFKRYHVIVVENDSKDGTRELLPKHCSSEVASCLTLHLPTLEGAALHLGAENRVKYLTVLRQSLLDEVWYFARKSDGGTWDYVLLFDGDIFEGGGGVGFSPAALYALLGMHRNSSGLVVADDPLDLVCANAINSSPRPGRFRDTFPLREGAWDEQVNVEGLFNDGTAVWFAGNELEHVKSCFSGLSLYSFRSLQRSRCNYTFVAEDVCEHVSLNQCLERKGFDDVAIYPLWAVAFEPHKQLCHDLGGTHWIF